MSEVTGYPEWKCEQGVNFFGTFVLLSRLGWLVWVAVGPMHGSHWRNVMSKWQLDQIVAVIGGMIYCKLWEKILQDRIMAVEHRTRGHRIYWTIKCRPGWPIGPWMPDHEDQEARVIWSKYKAMSEVRLTLKTTVWKYHYVRLVFLYFFQP